MKQNHGRRGSIAQPFIGTFMKKTLPRRSSKLNTPVVFRDKSNETKVSEMVTTKQSAVNTLESLTSLPDETIDAGINNITIMNTIRVRKSVKKK